MLLLLDLLSAIDSSFLLLNLPSNYKLFLNTSSTFILLTLPSWYWLFLLAIDGSFLLSTFPPYCYSFIQCTCPSYNHICPFTAESAFLLQTLHSYYWLFLPTTNGSLLISTRASDCYTSFLQQSLSSFYCSTLFLILHIADSSFLLSTIPSYHRLFLRTVTDSSFILCARSLCYDICMFTVVSVFLLLTIPSNYQRFLFVINSTFLQLLPLHSNYKTLHSSCKTLSSYTSNTWVLVWGTYGEVSSH